MPNKDRIVIQPSGEVISYTALQSAAIVFDEEIRQKAIQILRQIPAILDVAKKLSEGKTYQAVFSPEVLKQIKDGLAKLDEKNNGLFGALIREVETGHIIDHVELKKVMPDLLSSLNQLATQQTLADIVCRLEVIDVKITEILQGQFNDRLAEVTSGIHLYEQAVVDSDPDFRRVFLGNAIQNLEGGRSKLIKSIDLSFIDKLPRTKMEMRFHTLIHGDLPKYVQAKAETVWKAVHAIVEASRYIVLAYSALNKPASLRVSLEQVKHEVHFFQNKMGEIVNWLPPTSDWRESLTMISQGVLPDTRDLDEIPQKYIIVEFQPRDIAPPEGVEP